MKELESVHVVIWLCVESSQPSFVGINCNLFFSFFPNLVASQDFHLPEFQMFINVETIANKTY